MTMKFIKDISISDWIAIVALCTSVLALLYTYFYFSNTKKYELNYQYRKEILTWYYNVLCVLKRLRTAAAAEFPDANAKRDLLLNLSANIELGRFYFPNIVKGTSYGKNKLAPYRGYRNLVLDFLVFSYRLFSKDDAHKYLTHALELQKYFTSSVFKILEPRLFIAQTKRHTAKNFSGELKFDDFIAKDPTNIDSYMNSLRF